MPGWCGCGWSGPAALAGSGLSVAQVAAEVGFYDQSHFNRVFCVAMGAAIGLSAGRRGIGRQPHAGNFMQATPCRRSHAGNVMRGTAARSADRK